MSRIAIESGPGQGGGARGWAGLWGSAKARGSARSLFPQPGPAWVRTEKGVLCLWVGGWCVQRGVGAVGETESDRRRRATALGGAFLDSRDASASASVFFSRVFSHAFSLSLAILGFGNFC